MKLLEVDVDTLEEGFNDLAAIKYAEGPKCIGIPAASKKSNSFPEIQ